jgi:Ferric reductase like transmembrane component/Ferric reductase NAD binding domain/FAD-binding domain
MSALLTITTLIATANAAQEQNQNNATQLYLAELNESLTHNFLWSLLAFTAVVLVYKSAGRIYAHIRHLASLTNEGSQRYFAMGSPTMSWLKDHVLYAPLFHRRRAREIKVTKNLNFGSVPTRYQSLFITALIAVNIFSCVYNISWSDPVLELLPILRNRTGTLSVGNLIPILVMATIKNPLISLLDVSYDTFNMIHRWLGRVSILQGIAHTLCYVFAKTKKSGWEGMKVSVQQEAIWTGLIATIGFTILFLQAPKLIRTLAYEVFLHIHVVVVMITFAFLWMHLKMMHAIPQLKMLIGAIMIWGIARGWRMCTLAYRSWGREPCHAAIEAMPGDALRISIKSPRPWIHRPGQSLYITIPSVGWWTAHPFSVAWSDFDESLSRSTSVKSNFDEKKPIVRVRKTDVEDDGKLTYSLIVKARSGMTKKLLDKVQRAGGVDGAQISFNALIEGPYGGEGSMASYGTVMLFASGVGITHQMPYVRALLQGYNYGTVAARRVILIWVVPHTDYLEWIRPWMHDVLGMPGRREVLKVVLYVTRAGLSQPIRSPSETVRILRGRPDVQTLMTKEASEKMGCMGVSVCAGGGLADEVRRVSRNLCAQGVNLDFMEAGFGW